MTTELTASSGPAAGKSEKLVKDLKSVVVDADDLLKELAGSTAEGFAAARTKVEGRLSDARARLAEARIGRRKGQGNCRRRHGLCEGEPLEGSRRSSGGRSHHRPSSAPSLIRAVAQNCVIARHR